MFYDVDGNKIITALDTLRVINEINRRNAVNAEGEGDTGEGDTGGSLQFPSLIVSQPQYASRLDSLTVQNE